MCDNNSDRNSGQKSGAEATDGCHKSEEEEEDEDMDDEEESDEDSEEELTETEDNTEDNGVEANEEEVGDSDSEDETEAEEESDEEIENQASNGGQSPADGSEPHCYICLNRFSGQDIGSPESCDDLHYFCLECIEEWSKQINTCPVDRKIFTYIAVRREIGSSVIMKLPIVKNIVLDIESVPEDVTYCEICGRCDREDRLLLCDGCDFGYHCECLSPPLETIPIEEWFCPDCYHRLFGPDTSTSIRTGGAGPSALQRRRAIARTGASEAVRQRILQRRTQPVIRRPVRRKTTKRKRKTTRRRKTSSKRKKTTTSGTKTKRRRRRTKRRRKKRTKKSAFASRRLPAPTDPRTRIASKLGIGPPPKSPFGLPSMKNVSNESVRRLIETRAAAGISHLSLFGTELDVYDPRVQAFDEEEDLLSEVEGGVGLIARSRIGGRLIGSPSKRKTDLIQSLGTNELSNGSSVDLLSQIMSSQTILHSSSRDVRIGRDGTLYLSRDSAGLPVRNCGNSSGQSSPAQSPASSSPGRSPSSGSPQRTDGSAGAQGSSFNYSFGSASNNRTNSSANNDSELHFSDDISAVKPALSPNDASDRPSDDSKVELYSDIESVGDNTRDNNNTDDEEDKDSKQLLISTPEDQCLPQMALKISEDNGPTSDAIEPQSSDNCEPLMKNCSKSDKSKATVDSLDTNNSSDERPQTVAKTSDKTAANSVQRLNKSRKPSIKDLFGDSSDEEEDVTDIKRLLAEQGSINVHYPIKMSIVLKNSISRTDPNVGSVGDTSDANNSSDQRADQKQTPMQTLDSEPAPDLSKWVAVPPKDGIPVPDSTTTANKGINKWKAIESTPDLNPVVTNVEPICGEPSEGSDKWKPIERTGVSEPKVSAPEGEALATNETIVSIDVNMSESDLKSDEPQSVEQMMTTTDLLSGSAADEEEGEIRDDDQKVRRCRHGRIRREKTKEKDQKGDDSSKARHRSRSSGSESRHRSKAKDKEMGNKDIDCDNSVDNECSLALEDVEFKEKTIDLLDKDSEEVDNSESVGWKKLSNSSKMRSYRDGKPKDEEVLFREREPPKKLVKKSVLTKLKPKDDAKDQLDRQAGHEGRQKSRQPLDDMSAPTEETKQRKHRSEADKSEDSRRHKRKSDESMAKHKRRPDESARRSTSARRSPPIDEYNTQDSKERHKRHHKSSRHKRRDSSGHKDSSDRLVSAGADRSHRSHRSSKHSHHKSKADGDGLWPSGTPQKILRDHSSYSDITPLDSKEIYAEGDRIVINVNFNRNKKTMDSTTNEDSNYGNKQFEDSSDTRKGSISETKARVSSKKDDSIFWASPPPTANTSSSAASTQSAGPLTTTNPKIDDDLSSNHSNRSVSSGSDRKASDKSETETKKDSKSVEELRFLPRSLHQSDVNPIDGRKADPVVNRPTGPHTPEGDYNEDQFMPTPTQDESQSPVRSPSLSQSSRSSPLSISSPTETPNGSKDEVYDPEAPLQSPDSHQTKANSRRPDPKSPDVVVNSRQSSKRSPQPMSRRQASRDEPKSRHSKDERRDSLQKSSPMSSASHSLSNRSPFKSNPIPTQRQAQKPSPQKSTTAQHKSSQLMPPPQSAPTSRPSPASSIALTAATIASINPQNLAQLLQMAHALSASKRQASAQGQHQQHRSANSRPSAAANSAQNSTNSRDHSKDHNEVVDMDVESPSPPGGQQPVLSGAPQQPRVTSTTGPTTTAQVKTLWEQIIKTTQNPKPGISGQKRVNASNANTGGGPLKKGRPDMSAAAKHTHSNHPHRHQVVSVSSDNKKQLTTSGNKMDQLTVLDDVPSSAVEMAVKEKFIKKLNRQERVIEEVKLVLKPYYQKRTVTKEEYKEILRKSVPKICHSRSGEINPVKIKSLIDGYIKRFKHLRKKSVKLPKK